MEHQELSADGVRLLFGISDGALCARGGLAMSENVCTQALASASLDIRVAVDAKAANESPARPRWPEGE